MLTTGASVALIELRRNNDSEPNWIVGLAAELWGSEVPR